MARFRLRQATLKDLDTLVEHRHKLFEDLEPRTDEEHAIGDRFYRKWARDLIRRKRLIPFIIENRQNGEVAASGCVWLREGPPYPGSRGGPRPYLMSMYTEKKYRKLGLASRIVREAMRWCKRNGYSRMSLHASTMGRPVYRKLGWQRGWEMQIRLRRSRKTLLLRTKRKRS